MSLRQLPGALGAGLLASLLAHAAAFGDGHAEGGPFHVIFLVLAGAALLGFGLAAARTAAAAAGYAQSGSVLAGRLAGLVPSKLPVVASAFGWFALGESLEAEHSPASLLVLLVAIVAVALALRIAALAALRALAAIVISCETQRFRARSPRGIAYAPAAVRLPASPRVRRRSGRAPPRRPSR
jgi:hypothetical protein